MICINSVFQISGTIQPYKGILLLQKLRKHSIQIKKLRCQICFPKRALSALSVKDSEQDFFKLLKVSMAFLHLGKVPVVTWLVQGMGSGGITVHLANSASWSFLHLLLA